MDFNRTENDRNRPLLLLPKHGVYLSAPSGDGERLCSLFVRVWEQIREKDRETILSHWFQGSARIDEFSIMATELATEWCNRTSEYLETHGIVAQCRDCGCKVYFHRNSFGDKAAMIDEDACYYIAHELAHVTWIARKERFHLEAAANQSPDRNCGEPDSVDESCENLADDLAAEWGFLPPGELARNRVESRRALRNPDTSSGAPELEPGPQDL